MNIEEHTQQLCYLNILQVHNHFLYQLSQLSVDSNKKLSKRNLSCCMVIDGLSSLRCNVHHK